MPHPTRSLASKFMKIAITGARGTVGREVVCLCAAEGHSTVQINRTDQPLKFPHFPIDEDSPPNPTDAYALAKLEAETAARAFLDWFPGMKVACLRIHEVAPKKDVAKEHAEDWESAGVKQLWSWVHPVATARACLLAVAEADRYEGCQVFNIVAPDTTQDKTPSAELARTYHPDAEIRADMSTNRAFWTTDKAERLLGWVHYEKE